MVPDYYAMLGITPAADRSTIESALARCRPVWSSGTRNPKTKHTYQSYLDQIPTIRQTLLGDPVSRAAYDSELAAAAIAERESRLDTLQRLVKLRAAKGGLTVADITLLRQETKKLGLEFEELNRLTEPIPPKPEAPVEDDPPDPVIETIDPVMRKQIRMALDHLRKRDLYDALDLPRDISIREITSKADAERQRWMKKSQVTAEKTAWLEVVTLAQSHLTHPSSRVKYDLMLTLEAEETFQSAIEFTIKGLTNIDPGTSATLMDEAARLGIAYERASLLIRRTCRSLGVALVVGNGGLAVIDVMASAKGKGPTRFLRCRSCSALTDYSALVSTAGKTVPGCRHCGASLRWKCPVCKRAKWVDEPRCTCGFLLELREPVVQHLAAANSAFQSKQFGNALLHLRKVLTLAPNHVKAKEGIDQVDERLSAIEEARASYGLARAARNLREAKTYLEKWGKLVSPADPEWRSARDEVNERIAEALHHASKGRSREHSDPKSARDFYRKSLSIAADLPEALGGLGRTPPDPPTDLIAEYVGGRVKLRWSPPEADGLGPLTYVVLRKPEAPFLHPGDGLKVGASDGPTFDDSNVTPGTSVSYAVLSKRNGVLSSGAVAIGPIYLLGEVRDVRIDSRSKEIDLTWIPPANAIEIRVTRKRGSPPLGPLDGERIDALIDQAHDRGLETEKVYHYGIYAVYRTPDGRSTASLGVHVSAQPHTPVSPLPAPAIEPYGDDKILIRWQEPNRGMVKLLRTAKPIDKEPGERFSPSQAASLEGDWIEVETLDHAIDKPPRRALCYYSPLTSWGGNLTLGHTAVYSRIADPTDLQITRLSAGKLQLRWVWESSNAHTIVVMKPGSPPSGPDDPDANKERVYETDYHRLGHHPVQLPDLNGKAPTLWHFAVHAVKYIDGEEVVSPGSNPNARATISSQEAETIVSYQFSRRRLFGGWSILLKTDPPGRMIPPTDLVINPKAVPSLANDGFVVAKFAGIQDGAKIKLPRGINPRRQNARLFLNLHDQPEAYSAIRIRDPEMESPRF